MLREFTKVDWYGLSGAEKFKDGSEPLLGFVSVSPEENEESRYEAEIVVDQTGVTIVADGPMWRHDSLGSKDADRIFATFFENFSNLHERDLLQHGFERVN